MWALPKVGIALHLHVLNRLETQMAVLGENAAHDISRLERLIDDLAPSMARLETVYTRAVENSAARGPSSTAQPAAPTP